MSLNGLDNVAVTEGYQAALQEGGGGWFLLKYTSRDEVQLLTRGSGGVVELRNALGAHPDQPLYGFLLYRRRKILIKFTPVGTSRLLLARITVHFEAVSEAFSPYDTVLTITSAEELNDAGLAAACSLHTAPPSSSGSGQQRKLDEIREEEGSRPDTAHTAEDKEGDIRAGPTHIVVPLFDRPHTSDDRPGLKHRSKTSISQLTLDGVLDQSGQPALPLGSPQFPDYEFLLTPSEDRRLSSQTTRPTASDLYTTYYSYKPKIKLGPRPSIDRRRPQTSGGLQRPTSSLPAGVRAASRKLDTHKKRRTETTPDASSSYITTDTAPSSPGFRPSFSLTRPELDQEQAARPTSPAVSITLTVPTTTSTPAKPTISREKQRLMKALELRKKQQQAEAKEATSEMDQRPIETSRPVELEHDTTQGTDTIAKEHPSTKQVPQDGAHVTPDLQQDAAAQHQNSRKRKSSEMAQADNVVNTVDQSFTTVGSLSISAAESSPVSGRDSPETISTTPTSVCDDKDDDPFYTKPMASGATAAVTKEAEFEVGSDQATEVAPQDSSVDRADPEVEQVGTGEMVDERSGQALLTQQGGLRPDDSVDGKEAGALQKETSPRIFPDTTISQEPEDSLVPTAPTLGHTRKPSELREKRRGLVEPIEVDQSAGEEEYDSDDSFMEELKSATVHEAKPMSVSKSPITPFFPGNKDRQMSSGSIKTLNIRSVSNPIGAERIRDNDSVSPDRKTLGSVRSFSVSSRPSSQQQQEPLPLLPGKAKISSGISARIQALAEKTSRESIQSISSPPQINRSPETQASVLAFRQASSQSPPPLKSPNFAKQTRRISSMFTKVAPAPKKENTPPASNFLKSRFNTKNLQPPDGTQTVYNVQQAEGTPESVSVTARIIRDERTQKPDLTMPTETTPLELHQSPLIINHHKANASTVNLQPASPTKSDNPPSPLHPLLSSRESSVPALPRSSSEHSWRSLGRQKQKGEPKSPPPPSAKSQRSMSESSIEPLDDNVSTTSSSKQEGKRESRKSRFFKRMSTITPKSIINVMSPTVKEEEPEMPALALEVYAPQSPLAVKAIAPPIEVGDLNVQFPDTLLWKRRFVEIDSTGTIVLGLSKTNEQSKGVTKRYHLSEFRAPFAPDQDRQELPNSIIFDFLDGSTLQFAAADVTGQARVLDVMRTAHRAWVST